VVQHALLLAFLKDGLSCSIVLHLFDSNLTKGNVTDKSATVSSDGDTYPANGAYRLPIDSHWAESGGLLGATRNLSQMVLPMPVGRFPYLMSHRRRFRDGLDGDFAPF
jgi:hypothetical protein